MYSDHARTFTIENSGDEVRNNIVNVADKALQIGIENALPGNRIGVISNAIENYISSMGFGTVREYVGHGIGSELHEPPSVPILVKKIRELYLELVCNSN